MTTHPMAYSLEYLHQTKAGEYVGGILKGDRYEQRARLVVMYRHRADKMLGETEDSFTVRDAQTDEFLGAGDTKREANDMAQYKLMDMTRAELKQTA